MARVLISLPDDLLKVLDDFCIEAHYNRSEFLRYFIRDFIVKEQNESAVGGETDTLT